MFMCSASKEDKKSEILGFFLMLTGSQLRERG